MTKISTVLGSILPDELGVTLMHEHLMFAYPGWYADLSVVPYDRKDIESKCLNFLTELKSLGVQTIVDPSTADGWRDLTLMKNLANKTGINIITATGLYVEIAGAPHYFRNLKRFGRDMEEDVYEMFMKEITVGIWGTDVKAGVIKVATDDPVITEYEETVIRAAVRAAKETGVPILTHAHGETVGPKQQEMFLKYGANPKKIVIGHQNNSMDINYHLSQLKRPDFFIGFDRTSLGPEEIDNCIVELVKQGNHDRIILSHDYIMVWLGRPFVYPEELLERYGRWSPYYIHRKLIPKMKAAGITDEQIRTMLVENPRRLFG